MKLLKIWRNFIKRNTKVKIRDTFGIRKGTYTGEIWVITGVTDHNISIKTLPFFKSREVPIETFRVGLESGIVDYIHRLPKRVFKDFEIQKQQDSN